MANNSLTRYKVLKYSIYLLVLFFYTMAIGIIANEWNKGEHRSDAFTISAYKKLAQNDSVQIVNQQYIIDNQINISKKVNIVVATVDVIKQSTIKKKPK